MSHRDVGHRDQLKAAARTRGSSASAATGPRGSSPTPRSRAHRLLRRVDPRALRHRDAARAPRADETVVDMSVAAAGKALAARRHRPPTQIELRASSPRSPTCCRRRPPPRSLAHRLGATNAAAFDISAACAGFCYGVGAGQRHGARRQRRARPRHRLSRSSPTSPTPYDRGTAFIFGDGAGAVVDRPVRRPGHRPGRSGARTARSATPSRSASPGSTSATTPARRSRRSTMKGQQVFRWAVWQMAPVRAAGARGGRGHRRGPRRVHPAPGQPAHHRRDGQGAQAAGARRRRPRHRRHRQHLRRVDPAGDGAHARDAARRRSGGLALLIGFGAGLAYAAQVVVLP